jgi:hypothetical protein
MISRYLRFSIFINSSRRRKQPADVDPHRGLALDLLPLSVLYMNARHRRKMHDAAASRELSLDNHSAIMAVAIPILSDHMICRESLHIWHVY